MTNNEYYFLKEERDFLNERINDVDPKSAEYMIFDHLILCFNYLLSNEDFKRWKKDNYK